MIEMNLQIEDPKGIHMTAAEKIAGRAMYAESKVWLTIRDKKVNAEDFMALLSLQAGGGEELLVTVDGSDEEKTAEAIFEILKREWHARELQI